MKTTNKAIFHRASLNVYPYHSDQTLWLDFLFLPLSDRCHSSNIYKCISASVQYCVLSVQNGANTFGKSQNIFKTKTIHVGIPKAISRNIQTIFFLFSSVLLFCCNWMATIENGILWCFNANLICNWNNNNWLAKSGWKEKCTFSLCLIKICITVC